jgi:hypothetical protein
VPGNGEKINSDRVSMFRLWGGRSTMEDDLTRAALYRDKAANLRKMAEEDANPDTRGALLSVADQYDRICARLLERPRK